MAGIWTDDGNWPTNIQAMLIQVLDNGGFPDFSQESLSESGGAFRDNEGCVARLVQPSSTYGFVYPRWFDPTLEVRLTDDAGLHWQIDGDLHLQKLEARDW